jgi:hypothetical protein
MIKWTFVTTPNADPPNFGDTIDAPHPEPSPSNTFPSYPFIFLYSVPRDRDQFLWNSNFAILGSNRTRLLAFRGGVAGAPYEPLASAEIHGSYHFTLKIGDFASRQIGSLQFAGRFDGIVSNDYDMARISHTYLGPTTGQLHLGANLYTVSLFPFQSGAVQSQEPFPPYSGIVDDPRIEANIDVRPFVSDTPEPSTLCLAALGLVAGCGPGLQRLIRRR